MCLILCMSWHKFELFNISMWILSRYEWSNINVFVLIIMYISWWSTCRRKFVQKLVGLKFEFVHKRVQAIIIYILNHTSYTISVLCFLTMVSTTTNLVFLFSYIDHVIFTALSGLTINFIFHDWLRSLQTPHLPSYAPTAAHT